MSYAFVHDDKAYGPSGVITDIEGTPLEAKDAQAYNQALEAQELEHFKSGPERIFAYIGHAPMDGDSATRFDVGKEHYTVQTWLGTRLAWAWIGDKAITGFQSCYRGGTYRRPVTARIFGTLYHGWYFDSSGDYCRLKKAKNQTGKYAASRWYPETGKGTV